MSTIPNDEGTDAGAAASESLVQPTTAEILYPDDKPQPEEASPTDDKAEPKADGETAQDYDLRMPDGVALDNDLLTQAAPVLRDVGLSNDQANKLVPLVGQIQDRFHQTQMDAFGELRASWAKQAKADPQLGGANWSETVRLTAVALEAAGAGMGSEFRGLMDESGLGNHPEVIRVFRSLGRQLAAKGRGGESPSREQVLYPND